VVGGDAAPLGADAAGFEAPPPAWAALARIGTRRVVHPAHVVMRRAPEPSAATASYFGTQIRGGEADAVTFSAEDASLPFLTEDESMWNFFAPELRRRLSELEASATTADRVRAALHERLPAGESSINAIAAQLMLSPRTLQRQLQAEDTSYQAVLSDTREKLARRYLAEPSLPTSQVAYLLAYDDTNSFYRAFRRWTGLTPEAARNGGHLTPA
jgi:AraC-like DNA-binding protein